VPVAGPSTSPADGNDQRGLILTSDPKVPPKAIDKIRIERRSKDITGTYHLNPRPKKKFLGMSMNEDSEMRFSGREGNIDLNLSTGAAPNLSDNIGVKVSSRLGNVLINLTSLSPKSRTRLRAKSREGHVALFLPEDYSGTVTVATHRGSLDVLPGMSSLGRLETLTDKKQTLHFGTVPTPYGNCCRLYSRQGTVTLGLLGVDSFTPPEKVEGGKDDDSSDSSDSD